jgi:RNA:NAD 2'-phosphotransferase (TPT1/KptA family)
MIPKTLYHGTGVERLDNIMKTGILPTNTSTITKFTKAYRMMPYGKVHLTTIKNYAGFFAIAGHENGVILEVDTDELDESKFQTYRMFETEDVEYRYIGTINPESIKKIHSIIAIKDTWRIDANIEEHKKFIYSKKECEKYDKS